MTVSGVKRACIMTACSLCLTDRHNPTFPGGGPACLTVVLRDKHHRALCLTQVTPAKIQTMRVDKRRRKDNLNRFMSFVEA